MSTVQISTIIPLDAVTLIAYADIGFDAEIGTYVEFWEVMAYERMKTRGNQKPYDIGHLKHDDFQLVAEQIRVMCDTAVVMEAQAGELEASFREELRNRSQGA